MPDQQRSEPTRTYESPLRERQARQTREAILDALTALLADRRTDEVTTRELARTAGVSERTVYRHFPDRSSLVEGLAGRLTSKTGRDSQDIDDLADVRAAVIEMMAALEANRVEARAEALFNSDPRRYTAATRHHTEQFHRAVGASLTDLDDEQRLAIVAVVRVLVSAQTWLRLREEFDISGDSAGPIVAWVIDALVHEVEGGNPPPGVS
jgi:AcrR family transcriptional regulator